MKYIVSIPGIKKGSLEGKSCVLPVSLPLYPHTESWLGKQEDEQIERLKSIFNFVVNSKFKQFHVVLADTLQRFALMNILDKTESEALSLIEKKSGKFFIFLKKWMDTYLKNMGVDYDIVKWSAYDNNVECKRLGSIVNDAYKNNGDFRAAVNSTALNFVKNKTISDLSPESISSALQRNVTHIQEEIALLLYWNYDFLIYPSNPSVAMSKAYELFHKEYINMPNYQPIRFKNGEVSNEDLLLTYQDAIRHLPINVYCKDSNGRYLWCNEKFSKVLNLKDPSEISYKTDYDFLDDDLAKDITKNDFDIINTGTSKVVEEHAIIEGKNSTVLSQKLPLKNPAGDVIGIVGMSIDITDKKKVEELTAKNEAIKQIAEFAKRVACSVAHELRTPLITINLYAEQAEIDLAAEKSSSAVELLGKIRKLGSSSTYIISDMLEKIKSFATGKVVSELKEAKILDTIEEFLGLYPFVNKEESLVSIENRENDFVFLGDPILLRNVFSNLMRNSLRAIKEVRRGNIKIYLNNEEPEYNKVIFEDTGAGIPEQVKNKLFQPFESQKGGTGLGLHFCKLVMQSFNGSITFESVENEYTRFTLNFKKIQE